VRKAAGFTLDLRGTKLVYDSNRGTLKCKDVTAPIKPKDASRFCLTVLVDRGSVEVFGDCGRVAMSVAALPDEKTATVALTPDGGPVKLVAGTVRRVRSAWGK
jgi:fructan beta-fructosidase